LSPTTETLDLGKHIATFRGRSIEFSTWIFIFLPGILLVITCYYIGIYLAVNAYQQHGPAMAVARSQFWIIFGSILLLLLAVYLIFRILIALQRIYIFEGGLKWRNFFLRKTTYQWSQLEGISSTATRLTFVGKPVRTIATGKIFPKHRKPLTLSKHFLGVPKVIEIIKSRLYPLVWPQLKSAFLSGDSANFGSISVNADFLGISKRSFSWSSVARLYTEGGFMVVEFHDNSTHKVPTIDIPNIELLLNMIEWGIH